jgi:hypothetical protein
MKMKYASAKSGDVNELDSNTTVYPGDRLILEAIAAEYLPQAEIIWLRGNDSLQNGNTVKITSNYSAVDLNVPTFSKLEYEVSSEDADQLFGCRVKLLGRSYEYLSLSFQLTVGEGMY